MSSTSINYWLVADNDHLCKFKCHAYLVKRHKMSHHLSLNGSACILVWLWRSFHTGLIVFLLGILGGIVQLSGLRSLLRAHKECKDLIMLELALGVLNKGAPQLWFPVTMGFVINILLLCKAFRWSLSLVRFFWFVKEDTFPFAAFLPLMLSQSLL